MAPGIHHAVPLSLLVSMVTACAVEEDVRDADPAPPSCAATGGKVVVDSYLYDCEDGTPELMARLDAHIEGWMRETAIAYGAPAREVHALRFAASPEREPDAFYTPPIDQRDIAVVVISRGQIEQIFDSDEELACVLVHELGHHLRRDLSAAREADLRRACDTELPGAACKEAEEALSRSEELEADRFNATLASGTRYDPWACVTLFARILQLFGPGESPTHPSEEERMAFLGELLQERFPRPPDERGTRHRDFLPRIRSRLAQLEQGAK
jgi:hypothetical protein